MSPHHARPAVSMPFPSTTQHRQSRQARNQHQQQRQSWKEHGLHTQPIPHDEAFYRQTGVAGAFRWRRESMSGGLSPPPSLFVSPLAPGLLRGRPVLLRSEGRLERSLTYRNTWQTYGERRTGEPGPRRERVWNRHGTVMYRRLRHGQRDQVTVVRKGYMLTKNHGSNERDFVHIRVRTWDWKS